MLRLSCYPFASCNCGNLRPRDAGAPKTRARRIPGTPTLQSQQSTIPLPGIKLGECSPPEETDPAQVAWRASRHTMDSHKSPSLTGEPLCWQAIKVCWARA